MNKAIQTEHAPAAIGPYSQAVVSEGAKKTVYISGQLPIDPKTGAFAGENVESQTQQCLENIRNILKKENMEMCHVVKTTVLLKNIDDFAAMNQIYKEYFGNPFPARAAFQVAALPKDALVEIEAIAAL